MCLFCSVEGDTRVYYGCASLGSVGCIKRAGTYKIKSTYCLCDKDRCNGSPPLSKQYLIPFFIVSVVITVMQLLTERDV